MNTTLTSTLILKLQDQITGPTNQAAAALRSFQQAANGVSGSGGGLARAAANLRAAADSHRKTFDSLKGQFVTNAAAMAGFVAAIAGPVKAAANFQTTLVDIAQKIDGTIEKTVDLGEKIKNLSRGSGQSPQQIAGGVDTLIGMGVSKDDALTMAPPIAKAATAYRASITDLAKAATAALQNLKIPAEQLGKVLDVMAQAGKAGAFELKDMAQYIPALAAAYQGLGQTGVPALTDIAAALEIVRKGTGDSATAATNLQNVLQKIQSPTVSKNFEKYGIDIRKRLKDGLASGESPLDTLVKATTEALKGDLSKIGDIFEDAQAQAGLRALIQNYEEFKRIRDEAGKAGGVVDKDFEMRIVTLQAKFDTLLASLNGLAISIGQALTPALGALADAITPVIYQLDDFIVAHPDLTAGVFVAAGGFLAMSFALTSVRLAIAGINLATLAGLSTLATTAPAAGGWLKLALGLGAVAAALAAIDRNKDAIKGFFESKRPPGSEPLTDTKGGPFEITDNIAGYLKQMLFERMGFDKDDSLISILKESFRERKIEDLPKIPHSGKGDLPPGVKLPGSQSNLIFGPGGAGGGTDAKPKISLAGAEQAKADADEVTRSLSELDRMAVAPYIDASSISHTLSLLRQLKGEMNGLRKPAINPIHLVYADLDSSLLG